MPGWLRRAPRIPPAVILAVLLTACAIARAGAAPACSGTVPFFVLGACAQTGADAPPATDRSGLFTRPATRRAAERTEDATFGGSTPSLIVHAGSAVLRAGGLPTGTTARLTVRCRDGNTSLYFTFPGREMGNRGPQREIVYAIDDGEEAILELDRGIDHAVMGVWQGYRSVPLLRRLASARLLRVSAIAADGTDLRADFDLGGWRPGLERLRAACDW